MRNQKLLVTYDQAFEPLDLAEKIYSIERSKGLEGVAEFHKNYPDFNLCFLHDENGYVVQFVDTSYFNHVIRDVYPGYIIGANVSLLELAKYVESKEFVTLLDGDNANWLISWQDLNKAPFTDWTFSHISLLERTLKAKLHEHFENPEEALHMLPKWRQQKVAGSYRYVKEKNAETTLIHCFYFKDVLDMAIKLGWLDNLYGEPTKRAKQRNFARELNHLRNLIAHSNPIFEQHSDLKPRIRQIETLRNLLLNL